MDQFVSWRNIPENSDFSIYNLPFGIFSVNNDIPGVGVALGDEVINIGEVASLGLFDHLGIPKLVWYQPVLNDFIELGKIKTREVRRILQSELCNPDSILKEHPDIFYPMKEITSHMPIRVGDYTDFYSSIEHATNVGKMFRDPENALLPNWRHMPVGYHGRSSSIVLSGTPVIRPWGQVKKGEDPPEFQPTERLDFELEMALIIGKENQLGTPVNTSEAEEYLFGMVLFNDWSARDIQKWEYVPLGPFLGKNFASSISPWVVTMEALDAFRVSGPSQEPSVLSYLQFEGLHNYDIQLSVSLETKNGNYAPITNSNYKYMYWNGVQQIAHHTANGCNLRIGDLLASGTISGPTKGSYGSMLELSWGGQQPIHLSDGSTRTFVEDGDTITMTGFAQMEDRKVGFGSVVTKVLPALLP